MSHVDPMFLEEAVSFTEHGGLPPFEGSAPAIAFALRPAASASGATLALLGGYRLGAPYVNVYGLRPTGALHLVAVDAASGRVFTAVPAGPNELPIVFSMRDDDGASFAFGAVSGQFTVDLARQLGLPREAATYQVLIWLDDRATPLVAASLPAEPRRDALPPSGSPLRPPAATPRIERVIAAEAPAAPPGEIVLSATRRDDGSVLIEGALPEAALDEANPLDPEPRLTLLAYQYSRRDIGWRSVAIVEEMRAARATGFRAEVRPGPAQRSSDRLFVLATFGERSSPVAVVALDAP